MKKINIVLALVLLTTLNGYSQSLFEKLGGVKTNFTIVNNSKKIPILSQGIIKRDITETDKFRAGLSTLKAGYSYEVNHLEFITTSDIPQYYKLSETVGKKYYELILYDENDKSLFIYSIKSKWVKSYQTDSGLHIYSMDLEKIPAILLSRTKKISINKLITTSSRSKLKKNTK